MSKTLKARATRLTDLRLADRLREDDLRLAESRRLDDIRRITRKTDHRAAKAERLRIDAVALAESRRVDANRAGDVSAVALASARAEMTATNLSEKATDSAAALATQVEAVAKVAATAVEATTHALIERIEPLERARYEQAGRGNLAGPLQMAFAALVGGLVIWIIQQLLLAATQ